VDLGSSFLPGELMAAFLYAQLEHAREITARRRVLCGMYQARLADLERQGHATLPHVPTDCETSGHVFHLLLRDAQARAGLIAHLRARGVLAVSHYVPLHSSPAGRRHGRAAGPMPITDRVSGTLLRLPLYYQMSDAELEQVCEGVLGFFSGTH
jgi:dTDP-4-amino-4,6-dideoxygalactose transaminase